MDQISTNEDAEGHLDQLPKPLSFGVAARSKQNSGLNLII